jgi:hypothetical protein
VLVAPPRNPVVSTGSSPTSGPFGELGALSPARRLDGSLWSDPPWQATAYGGHWGGHRAGPQLRSQAHVGVPAPRGPASGRFTHMERQARRRR